MHNIFSSLYKYSIFQIIYILFWKNKKNKIKNFYFKKIGIEAIRKFFYSFLQERISFLYMTWQNKKKDASSCSNNHKTNWPTLRETWL